MYELHLIAFSTFGGKRSYYLSFMWTSCGSHDILCSAHARNRKKTNLMDKVTNYAKVACVLTLFKVLRYRQGTFIYITHFTHSGNSRCFT